jgi:hypothetical protein
MEQQGGLSKLKEPIFSRKKSLLTVNQYAARQGVSAGVVQEAAKLGVVQVRKHKNKTFIVDLPLDVYKITKHPDSPPSEEIDTESCTNKITELVNRIFQSDNETQLLPADFRHKVETGIDSQRQIQQIPQAAPRHSPAKAAPLQQWNDRSAEILDLNLFAEETNELADNKDINEHALSRFRIPLLRNITESIRSISVWKILLILMTAAFAISISTYVWASIDRKIQQQKLRDAYESIGNLMTKYEDARQKARLYELDITNWRSEAERSEKALIDYKAELQNVKKSLDEARRDLQSTQQYNMETLRTLNDQISKIRSQVPNLGSQPIE